MLFFIQPLGKIVLGACLFIQSHLCYHYLLEMFFPIHLIFSTVSICQSHFNYFSSSLH